MPESSGACLSSEWYAQAQGQGDQKDHRASHQVSNEVIWQMPPRGH